MSLVLTLPLLFLISCHYAAAQTIALQRSGQSCPNDMVTYDCDFEMGIALEWILEPYFPRSDPIRFLASQPIGTTVDCNDATTVQCVDINFVANLTNVANPMTVEAAMVFDMNSTLTIYAAPGLNVSMLQCKGTVQTGGVIIENITLNFSAPSPPRTPSSTVQQYGRDSVTLTVQWDRPQYDGGAPVNYTTTVSPGVGTFTTSGTSIMVAAVPYNMMHTVTIVATNCIGNSSAAMDTFQIVNCGDPTVPRNGSIDPYQNTTEGAEIVFRCDRGFDPAGDMTAVCAANGSWTPDPSTTMCNSTGTHVLLPLWAFVLAAIGQLIIHVHT